MKLRFLLFTLLACVVAHADVTGILAPVGGGSSGGSGTVTSINGTSSTLAATGGPVTSSGALNFEIPTGGVTDTLASFSVKPAVTVVCDATCGNLALTGVQTIDGQAGTAGVTIVLLTAQATASQNGPWIEQTGAWTRPAWFPSGGTTEAIQFSTYFVRLGSVYAGSVWRQTSAVPATIDTTGLVFSVVVHKLNSTTSDLSAAPAIGSATPSTGAFTTLSATTPIPVTSGGNGLSTATLGDLRYGSGTNTLAALAGNTTATKNFLTQTGAGSVSAAPAWGTIAAADLPAIPTTDLTGQLQSAQEPAHTGDMVNSAGSLATSVVKVNGGSIPVSASLLGSNASNQIVSTTTPLANSFTAQTSATPVNIIYDDDCTGDVDCTFTLSALHHWVDTGNVKVLALMANSANAYAAPVVNIMNAFWGHASFPIGTYKGSNVTSTGNTSSWASGTVTQFNAGDTSSNYTDCITVYRTALAAAPAASIKIVSTGFLSCIAGLMASAADGISSLTGAQLIQAKVTGLFLLGGDYPTGTEFNMVNDPVDANYVFANWTTQNGYPNITLNGFTPGNSLTVGRPLNFPATDPAVYAANLAGHVNRPGWDILSLYQAIFGTSAFTASANGTNSVNSSTGANTWSSGTASGHIYYTLTNSAAFYNALLDGQFYQGANWWMPAQKSTSAALQAPGIMCSTDQAGCQLAGSAINLSNSLNTPLFKSTQNWSASTVNSGYFIDPSLTSGQQINIELGHDLSTNNAMYLGYYYSTTAGSQHIGFGFYGGSDIIDIYQKGQLVANGGLVGINLPVGTAAFAVGSGVTSVACASGYSCNNTRGTLTIVGGTATTGTIATVSFSASLNSTPTCFTFQNGGTTFLGIGNGVASASSFPITAGVSVSGATFNVNYICLP